MLIAKANLFIYGINSFALLSTSVPTSFYDMIQSVGVIDFSLVQEEYREVRNGQEKCKAVQFNLSNLVTMADTSNLDCSVTS